MFESSGYAHTKVKQLIRLWESAARKRLGPEHRASVWQGRSSSRITLSTIIHYRGAIAVLSRIGDHLVVILERVWVEMCLLNPLYTAVISRIGDHLAVILERV